MSALQKNKSTQTSGSRFSQRIEKAKKTKFELELIKNIDCFLDGQGSYHSNLVSFKKESLQQTKFLFHSVRVMSVPKENKILVRNEIPNQKVSSVVRFQNKTSTTCQVSNQFFYNASDFKTKFLHHVRF